MIHYLKTEPELFHEVYKGIKKFEIRKDDRGFQVGDILCLILYAPGEDYDNLHVIVGVTYIFKGGRFGLAQNYVVMSIHPLSDDDISLDTIAPNIGE